MRKWYRYPFLDYGSRPEIGGSKEKALESLAVLKKMGYVDGYVTMSTFDWHIDKRLRDAIANGMMVDYQALRRAYLGLLKEWCLYFVDLYGQVPHTLLLHASDLNALYLNDILQMIEALGWKVISPEEAFADNSWRTKVVNGPGSFVSPPHVPVTMDCEEIDKTLEKNHVFFRGGGA